MWSIDPIMDLLGRRWEDLGLAWRILAGFEQQGRQKFCRVNRQLSMACNSSIGYRPPAPQTQVPRIIQNQPILQQ